MRNESLKKLNFGFYNIDYVYNMSELVRALETISALSTFEHPGGKGLNQAVAAASSISVFEEVIKGTECNAARRKCGRSA